MQGHKDRQGACLIDDGSSLSQLSTAQLTVT